MKISIALISVFLIGCTNTGIVTQYASDRCKNYRDSGTQSQARLIADIATGYPIVRIFCTHEDAIAWADNVAKQGKDGATKSDQSLLTTELIQTAGALVLLPAGQRTTVINSFPNDTRSTLLTLVTVLGRIKDNTQ